MSRLDHIQPQYKNQNIEAMASLFAPKWCCAIRNELEAIKQIKHDLLFLNQNLYPKYIL